MAEKYLVNELVDGEEYSKIMTPAEIFNMMDMEDCYDIKIDLWKINGYGEALTPCQFFGKWTCGDPQRMEIRSASGIESVGYGTEH